MSEVKRENQKKKNGFGWKTFEDESAFCGHHGVNEKVFLECTTVKQNYIVK